MRARQLKNTMNAIGIGSGISLRNETPILKNLLTSTTQLTAVAFLLNGKILSSWYAHWVTPVKPIWQAQLKKMSASGIPMLTKYSSDSASSNFRIFYWTRMMNVQEEIITNSTRSRRFLIPRGWYSQMLNWPEAMETKPAM